MASDIEFFARGEITLMRASTSAGAAWVTKNFPDNTMEPTAEMTIEPVEAGRISKLAKAAGLTVGIA